MTQSKRTPEIWVCRSCRIGLNHRSATTHAGIVEESWHHSRGEHDHQPDPIRIDEVPGGEIRTICDICSQPNPMNLWTSASFGGRLQSPDNDRWIDIRDRDNAWLVCDDCEPLVVEGSLTKVLQRALPLLQALHPETSFDMEVRALIADRISGFLNSRMGSSERRAF